MLDDTLIDLGRRVRPHADVPGQGRTGPRSSHQRLLDVAGRRRHPRRHHLRRDRRAWAINAVENVVHVRDLHATMLHLLGIDHQRFTVKFQGLDMRLTGVEPARVVRSILT